MLLTSFEMLGCLLGNNDTLRHKFYLSLLNRSRPDAQSASHDYDLICKKQLAFLLW